MSACFRQGVIAFFLERKLLNEWPDKPHVVRLAPTGWKKERLQASQAVQPSHKESAYSIYEKESRSTWANRIAQVYEVDPLTCCRCGSPIQTLAVITEPEEVGKILRHMVKISRGDLSDVAATTHASLAAQPGPCHLPLQLIDTTLPCSNQIEYAERGISVDNAVGRG